jgi:hypothetical protein
MRRLALFLCAVTAVVSLAVGSGGFSSVEADRGVTVDVVGDENAYLALEYDDDATVEATVGDDVSLDIVSVKNQFTEDVNVTVDYGVDGASGLSVTDSSDETELGVGNTAEMSTTVTCDEKGEYTVSFDATATGEGVSAETGDSRTAYTVDCNPESQSG